MGGGGGLAAWADVELAEDVGDVHAGGPGEMNSSAAMSRLPRPAATSRSTSCSRVVSPNGASPTPLPGLGNVIRARRASWLICCCNGSAASWPASSAARCSLMAASSRFPAAAAAAGPRQSIGERVRLADRFPGGGCGVPAGHSLAAVSTGSFGRERCRVGIVQRAPPRHRRSPRLQVLPQLGLVAGSWRQADCADLGGCPHRRGQQRPGVTRIRLRVVDRKGARGG